MASDKDLNEIVQQLITALKGISSDKAKSFTAQDKTRAEETSEKSAADIKKIFTEEQERLSGKIENNVRLTQEHAEKTIDAEQIINELKEERIRQITEEFRENQLVLLQLRKKLEEANKDKDVNQDIIEQLKEKIGLYEAETIEQAKILEGHKKEKQAKEQILSIGKEIFQNAKQYTLELEKHIMNISKLNGGYAEFGSKLREANMQIYQGTAGTGIMFEEANAAFAGLSQNFIGLTTQSEKSISQMVKGAAQLTKLGVDAGSAAKSMDSLVNSMGKTPAQAIKIQDSFVQMAAKNRLALGAVSQAFAENSNRFVGYGEQMTKVLDGLAEQSLKTGIAIGKLVSIAQGFDTFEDASRKVGNLNALLGGDYFNSIELLTASDEERIRLLKEGVAASGMQFESMNRFQKMAIANAAGISDLNEAAKLFGQTSLQNTRQQEDAAKVQKTLAEQAESVSTSMDKMKSVINGVIIALDPLVSFLGLIVEGLTIFARAGGKLGEEVGGWGGKIITVIGSVISLSLIWASTNLLLGKGIGGLASGLVSFVSKIPQYIAGLRAKKAAEDAAATPSAAPGVAPASGATGGFLANAGNMIKAAGAMLIFAAAMFVMAKAFQEFGKVENPTQAVVLAAGALLIFTGAMVGLNRVQGEIIKGSIIIGIMSLVLLGLAIVLSKFVNVDWKLVGAIGAVIIGLALAIVGLGAVFTNPITAAALATGMAIIQAIAVVIGILALALTAVVLAISLASPAITNLANSFKALFEIKDLKENFSNLESFLSQLSSIDIEPINNLANAIYNLATNLEALAAIPSKMGINVTGKTDLTETMNKTVANAAEATTAISKATTAATSQALIPAQQTTAFVPLVVQIDKQTILKVLDVEEIIDSKFTTKINTVGIVQNARGIQLSPPQETVGDGG